MGASSRMRETAWPTGATIDQSLSRLGVSSHMVARSQLRSEITSCVPAGGGVRARVKVRVRARVRVRGEGLGLG